MIDINELDLIKQELLNQLKECQTKHSALLLKSQFLGNNSKIKSYIKQIKDFSIENKQKYGKLIQERFNELENIIEEKLKRMNSYEKVDCFLPVYSEKGSKHIIPHIINDLKRIFLQMNFNFIDSPEIENTFRNFNSLNVPENHPCRDNHQSFFLKNSDLLLRTHTSNTQSYAFEKFNNNFNMFTIGKTYRRDLDSTHVPMFHQYEVMKTGKETTLKDLFQTIKTFLSIFFEIPNPEIRIRPSFFPFTEPSYEIDMKLNNNWLELLGCGCIHPNVFKANNKPKEIGWALGGGVERLAMIKYNIKDLRDIYTLNTFKIKEIYQKTI